MSVSSAGRRPRDQSPGLLPQSRRTRERSPGQDQKTCLTGPAGHHGANMLCPWTSTRLQLRCSGAVPCNRLGLALLQAANGPHCRRWRQVLDVTPYPSVRAGVMQLEHRVPMSHALARQCGSRDVTTTVHAARQPITAIMSAAEAPTATLNGIRQIIGTRSAASANTPHPQVLMR
jgi:hypothetical protein